MRYVTPDDLVKALREIKDRVGVTDDPEPTQVPSYRGKPSDAQLLLFHGPPAEDAETPGRWRPVTMHGDATIDDRGLITVTGGTGGSFPITYDDGTYVYSITATGGQLTLTTTETASGNYSNVDIAFGTLSTLFSTEDVSLTAGQDVIIDADRDVQLFADDDITLEAVGDIVAIANGATLALEGVDVSLFASDDFLVDATDEVNILAGDFMKLRAPTYIYLEGPVILDNQYDMIEMTAPAAPAANRVRLYAEDNGSGKTRIMARFATGAAQQIAIEP